MQKSRTVDAYGLRDTFLDTETSGEAMEFLSLNGFFLNPKQVDRVGPSLTMTWAEFQQWQELIRQVLTNGFFKISKTRAIDYTSRFLPDVPTNMNHLLSRLSAEEQRWLAGQATGIMIQPRGGNPVRSVETNRLRRSW